MPRFVRKELAAYVVCDDFARGLACFQGDGCRFERVVASSCKTRGFHPSCGANRMAGAAAHLVERVFRPRDRGESRPASSCHGLARPEPDRANTTYDLDPDAALAED